MCHDTIIGYWNRYPPEKKVARARFRFYKNDRSYSLAKFFKYDIPVKLYMRYARMTNNSTTMKNARLLEKLVSR
jgi:hypothetical protein